MHYALLLNHHEPAPGDIPEQDWAAAEAAFDAYAKSLDATRVLVAAEILARSESGGGAGRLGRLHGRVLAGFQARNVGFAVVAARTSKSPRRSRAPTVRQPCPLGILVGVDCRSEIRKALVTGLDQALVTGPGKPARRRLRTTTSHPGRQPPTHRPRR
jgi:hypothetical protein